MVLVVEGSWVLRTVRTSACHCRFAWATRSKRGRCCGGPSMGYLHGGCLQSRRVQVPNIYIRTLVPKAIKCMVFKTRVLKYWVLRPSGIHTEAASNCSPEDSTQNTMICCTRPRETPAIVKNLSLEVLGKYLPESDETLPKHGCNRWKPSATCIYMTVLRIPRTTFTCF